MATGFGIEPTKNGSGVITSGQTAEDTRRVWGALYTDGILRGCEVTTSGSSMTYTVAPGAVVIPYATGQVVPAPFYGGQITVASGGSGRTDIIWAKQNVFSEDGNSNIVLQSGSSMPATRCVELARFSVGSGITNTNAALRSANRRFAVPLSNGAGVIHQWRDEFDGIHNQNMLRQGHGTYNFATDRRVRMSIQACLSAAGANGFDNGSYCEWGFFMNIDGADYVLLNTPGLHQAWATYMFEFYVNVPAGQHTFSFGRQRMVGPGQVVQHYGLDNRGFGLVGTTFTVEDCGPVV